MDTAKVKLTGVHNRLLRKHAAAQTAGAKVTIGPQPGHSQPTRDHQTSDQSTIEVHRNEQGVETIEVVCSCGEKIVIRCSYDQ